jgi:hypothetical protein
VSYLLTYSMMTGAGRHVADTAQQAVDAHLALSQAGALHIVVKDAACRIVSITSLVALAVPEVTRKRPAARRTHLSRMAATLPKNTSGRWLWLPPAKAN